MPVRPTVGRGPALFIGTGARVCEAIARAHAKRRVRSESLAPPTEGHDLRTVPSERAW
jgi:hypothetical protein